MTRLRNLNRRPQRAILRHTTRMLGGARRPPPPDYLALACRALREVIRIDKSLRPFMEEQRQMLDRFLLQKEIQAALSKVYGDEATDAPPSPPRILPSVADPKVILKGEMALAKSHLLLERLKSTLGKDR